MKRALALVLALVMLCGCLTGCGGGNKETQGSDEKTTAASGNNTTEVSTEEGKEWFGTEDGKVITLRFWAGIQPEYGYADMVENFNKEYESKGLKVEYVKYVNNTDGNLQLDTYLQGGGEIDVFIGYGGTSRLKKRAEAGLIMDLSEYIEKYDFDIAAELGASSAAKYVNEDGSTYALPTQYSNSCWFIINADMFREAGLEIPYDGWTYDEFYATCEKLTKGEGQDKTYGMCWSLNFANSAYQVPMSSVLQEAAWYKDEAATESNLDNEVWKVGIQLMKDTMDNGWAISLEDELADQVTVDTHFLTGKCAMFLTSSQLRLCMDTTTYPHDFETAMVPYPVPGEEYATPEYMTHASQTGTGDLICVPENTEYKDAAFEFVMWYIKGGMAPLIAGGRNPLWVGITKEQVADVLTKKADGTVDMESMMHFLSVDRSQIVAKDYSSDYDGEIKDILWEEVQAILYGMKTVDQGMNDAKTRADELLKGK
ncbi:MAG: extracellular solute-binding protein [Lachnospiraceae bacterium]|nr:extracellular solute-binding protein [Lachnospiraceae bacterium]